MQIYWCADAWGAEIRKVNKQAKDLVTNLLKQCELRMINKIESVIGDTQQRKPTFIKSQTNTTRGEKLAQTSTMT